MINWKHMVVGMLKSEWILHLCRRCFYSGLNMTLECKNTKLWPVCGCFTMSLPWKAERINGSMLSCNMLLVAWLQKWMNKEPAFEVSALWGRRNTKWCIQSLWLLLPNIVMHRARICYEFLGFNPTAWTATVFSVVGMRRWGLHFPPALSTPSIAQKNTSVSMVTICHGNRTSRRVHAHDDPSRHFHNWPPICRVHRISFQTSYPVMYRVMISRPVGHTGFVLRPRPQNNEPLNPGTGWAGPVPGPGRDLGPRGKKGTTRRRDSGALARSKASRLLWRFFAWGVVWIRALLHCRSAFLKCVLKVCRGN